MHPSRTSRLTAALSLTTAVLLTACASNAPVAKATEDLPQPQSGVWQVTSTDQTSQQVSFKDCMDGDTFRKTRALQEAKREAADCKTQVLKVNDGWEFSSNCKVGANDQRIETSRKISGDFKQNFHVLAVSKQQMPDGSVVETSRNIKGDYLGACPADMKPGDRLFTDGERINFFEVTGMPKK